MSKKTDKNLKHSPARIYEFEPKGHVDANSVNELAKVIRVGIPGDLYGKLSPELQQHFKEVA
jgi:hypothetical protein